jgi:hypothetical protein
MPSSAASRFQLEAPVKPVETAESETVGLSVQIRETGETVKPTGLKSSICAGFPGFARFHPVSIDRAGETGFSGFTGFTGFSGFSGFTKTHTSLSERVSERRDR